MKKLLLAFTLLISSLVSFGQSETHDFITYDTIVPINPANLSQGFFALRITRPLNYFTPGHPDTASRRIYWTMPGAGEMPAGPASPVGSDSNTLKSYLNRYGPHYWMQQQGWPGGIQTGSGTHYPIFITWTVNAQNVRPQYVIPTFLSIVNKFHPRGGKVDLAGLSMGAWTWGRLYCYKAYAGDDRIMEKVNTITFLQGQANDLGTSYNMPGYTSFGYGARKYGLKVFGVEGTQDTRNVHYVTKNMNDSVPLSAYFTFENRVGGGKPGGHGAWNEMWDPAANNWKNTGSPLGPYIATNTNFPNTPDNYKVGDYIIKWAFVNGDTTLAGANVIGPVANAGPDQTVYITSATLNGSATTGATTYLWTKESGPAGGTISNNAIASPTISGLVNGTYVYKLVASDGTNPNSEDFVTIFKTDAANIPPTVSAGPDRNITLPKDSIHLAGTKADSDGTIVTTVVSKVSGGSATIVNTADETTAITGLAEGSYSFRVTVTDNSGATSYDEMNLNVVNTATGVAKSVRYRLYYPAWGPAYQQGVYNNYALNGQTDATVTAINDDGTASPITIRFQNFHQYSNNAANGAYGVGQWTNGFPMEVGQQTSYFNSVRYITFNNLDNSKKYDLSFFSSRKDAAPSTLISVDGYPNDQVQSGNNFSDIGVVTNVSPVNNQILVRITNVGAYSYINGGTISEVGAAPPENLPPVITSITNPTTITNPPTSSVALTVAFTDEYSAGCTILWDYTGPPGATFSGGGTTASTTMSGLTPGTYNVRASVTDTASQTTTATTIITVNQAGNAAPTANAGPDQNLTITPPNTVISANFDGSGADSDGTIVGYTWTFKSGPSGYTIVNPTAKNSQVTGLVEGTYVFTLTVEDNNGAKTSDDVTINVGTRIVDDQPKYIAGNGEYQTYFIDDQRHLWGVGNITNIGDGGVGPVGVPKRVAGAAFNVRFIYVAGGLHGGIAIDEDGYVWVMGDNDQGQHGQGDQITTVKIPRQITIDSAGLPFNNVWKVEGAYHHARAANAFYAIKRDSTLWVWGKTWAGFRGNGTDSVSANQYNLRPVQVIIPGNKKVKDISTGTSVMVLCTDGSVYTFGQASAANLGYTFATTKDYQTPHLVPGLPLIAQIEGCAGKSYALDFAGQLWGWGFGNYLGDLTYPTANGSIWGTPRILNTIMQSLPAPIWKIATIYPATAVILTNGDLYTWGDNTQGAIGNGESTDWTATDPPYALSGGALGTPGALASLFVKRPYHVAPGIKFREIWGGNVYNYFWTAITTDDQLLQWGRNKASVMADRLYAPTSDYADNRQNAWDRVWPTPVDPFNITSAFASPSPDCVNGQTPIGDAPCNGWSIPVNVAPVARAGSNRTVSTSETVLDGSASTDNVYIGWYKWRQIPNGGPSATISLPGSPITKVFGMSDGIYDFELTVEDNGRFIHKDTVTIVVQQSGNQLPVITPIVNKSITLPVNAVALAVNATDNDGSITTYAWTTQSAPVGSAHVITGANTANPNVTNLIAGNYVFKVRVTDNSGGFVDATANVHVDPPINTGGGIQIRVVIDIRIR